MDVFSLVYLIILSFLASKTNTQQLYTGDSALNCLTSNGTNPSPEFLYTFNGEKTCQSFLVFRSQSPYDSVISISNLTSSDPLKLASINNVSISETFPNNKEVILPVTCSRWKQYYQANSSYIIQDIDTYYTIATITYQGLSTCSILMLENSYPALDLQSGTELSIPLRCACPTKNQTLNGTKFLLTYLVSEGDTIIDVCDRFNASTRTVVYANGFSDEYEDIKPMTTILIPLSVPPLSNQTRIIDTPADSPSHTPTKRIPKKSRKGIYFGIGIGIFVAFLSIFLFLCLYHYKGKRALGDIWKKKNIAISKELVKRITNDDQALKFYDFEEVREGTENFNPQNKLSPLVYRGVFRGQVLCVKKVGNYLTKEVKILKTINHFNLIKLHGACENLRDCYLIYEYLENGSLKNCLREGTCSELDNWNFRIQIALDVASGLQYLHSFTYPAYVHKDINTSNVLLSRELRAKIANFSLARSAENGISLPKFAQKVKGYIAPEYIEAGIVTPKVDVYAFGVLLLELITGKEAVFEEDGEEVLLSETVLLISDGVHKKNDFLKLIDPRLQVKHPLGFIIDKSDLALRMIKLGVSCIADEPTERPSMGKVVSTLMRIQMDEERAEDWSLSQQ